VQRRKTFSKKAAYFSGEQLNSPEDNFFIYRPVLGTEPKIKADRLLQQPEKRTVE
jgi:hypothetical protein